MSKLDSIEIDKATGTVMLRFEKSNGGWHRTAIPISGDMEKQIELVNLHLVSMGHRPFVDIKDRLKIKQAVKRAKELFEEYKANDPDFFNAVKMLQLPGAENET